LISGTGKSRLSGAEAVETTLPGEEEVEVEEFVDGEGGAAAPVAKGCCPGEAEGAETAARISWAEASRIGEPPDAAAAAAAARKRPAVASLPRRPDERGREEEEEVILGRETSLFLSFLVEFWFFELEERRRGRRACREKGRLRLRLR
jgi:hypothetical protein